MSARGSTLDLGGLFRALASFEPTLLGTFPLGLVTATSDIDVACTTDDLDLFEEATKALFSSHRITPSRFARLAFEPPAVVVSLSLEGLAVELFCQPLPVFRQHAFRHMIVEGRLLAIGGAALRERVLRRKLRGTKTEPAFAEVLGLVGDPYAAVLALETESPRSLEALVARALAS